MKTKFVGKVIWGSCSEAPEDGGKLSEAAIEANDLGVDEMPRLLSDFIGCRFDPNNIINDLSDVILTTDLIEIEDIKILEMDYSDYGNFDSLPNVMAEVRFSLETPRKLTQRLLKIWENENKENIFSGLNFYWKDDSDDIYFDGDKGFSLEVDE